VRALVAAVDIAEKIRSTLASTPELLLESYASVKQAALTPELWGPDSMTTSAEGLIGLERLFLNYWNTVSGDTSSASGSWWPNAAFRSRGESLLHVGFSTAGAAKTLSSTSTPKTDWRCCSRPEKSRPKTQID